MSSTMSLTRLVEDYLADARARGLSPKTIKDAYGYTLEKGLLAVVRAARRAGRAEPR